ncbi:MAG: hypothetical protein M1840_003093, partial [Geoglossum simile]
PKQHTRKEVPTQPAGLACNRRPRPPTSKPSAYPPRILSTDPRAVADLWAKVAAYTIPRKGGPQNYMVATSASRGRSTASSRKESTTEGSAALPSVRPKDYQDFREFELHPRGITFPSTSIITPSCHFAKIFDKQDYEDNYKHSKVWLNLTDDDYDDIANEFDLAFNHRDNEAYLTCIAEKYLIPCDRRQPLKSRDVTIVTHDTAKWGLNPPKEGDTKHDKDFGPPVLYGTLPPKPYKFNLNPDKTFMLSSTVLSPILRFQLYAIGAFVRPGGTCPYLTYEMKKAPDMLQAEAENQIAAAASFWLHSRCDLRIRANEARSRAGKPLHTSLSGLAHYGIIIFGYSFTIWVADPTLKDEATGIDVRGSVNGYTIRNVWGGNLNILDGIRHYVTWQNWIHHWALGPFLEDFKRDVAALTVADEPNELSLVAAKLTISS